MKLYKKIKRIFLKNPVQIILREVALKIRKNKLLLDLRLERIENKQEKIDGKLDLLILNITNKTWKQHEQEYVKKGLNDLGRDMEKAASKSLRTIFINGVETN